MQEQMMQEQMMQEQMMQEQMMQEPQPAPEHCRYGHGLDGSRFCELALPDGLQQRIVEAEVGEAANRFRGTRTRHLDVQLLLQVDLLDPVQRRDFGVLLVEILLELLIGDGRVVEVVQGVDVLAVDRSDGVTVRIVVDVVQEVVFVFERFAGVGVFLEPAVVALLLVLLVHVRPLVLDLLHRLLLDPAGLQDGSAADCLERYRLVKIEKLIGQIWEREHKGICHLGSRCLLDTFLHNSWRRGRHPLGHRLLL